MRYEITVPKLSGTMSEGTLVKWYKNKGDEIKLEEPFFDISTEKINNQILSEYAGIIVDILVDENQKVKVEQVIAIVEGEKVEKIENNKETKVHKEIATPKNDSKVNFDYFKGLMGNKIQELKSDIAILGGGPAGYVAAIVAAKKGAKVSLIEMDKLGGTCLNWGCIPTKSLIRSAQVYKTINKGSEYGINIDNVSINYKEIKQRKDNIVLQLRNGVETLMKNNNINVIKAYGKLIDKNTIEFKGNNLEGKIQTENIMIATGSKACHISIPGGESKNVINSNGFLEMNELPASIVIIGGGVVGMEYAFFLKNMGVEVSVIEMMSRILPMCDFEISEELKNIAISKGIKLYLSSKVTQIMESENGGSIVLIKNENVEKAICTDRVLISIGRVLNVDNIGLEEVGIKFTNKGIIVDEYLRTNVKNIFAIGDINGENMLAHAASKQGIIAAKNALGENIMYDDIIPAGIFTDPEISYAGLTEQEAKENGIDFKVSKFPFISNGKSLTYGETNGFVKLIAEKSTNKVIGAHIIGIHATDLIPELTLAIEKGLTFEDIANTVHTHPTTAETIMEAAHILSDMSIHI